MSICPEDSKENGSCQRENCSQLHLCENYLLNNQCLEFQSNGHCSHSHSLSTKHNSKLLQNFSLSVDDQSIWHFLSHLLHLTIYQIDLEKRRSILFLRFVNQQRLTLKLINHLFQDYYSLIQRKILFDQSTILLTFDDHEGLFIPQFSSFDLSIRCSLLV